MDTFAKLLVRIATIACVIPGAVHADGAAQTPKRRAEVKTTPIALGDRPVTVTLESLPAREGVPAMPITEQVKSLAPGRRLYLIVDDLRVKAQPGVLYHIYLDLPAKPTPEQLKAHRVCSLNFFAASGHADPPVEGKIRSFDVTGLTRSLHAEGKLREKPVLTIAPAGPPEPDSKPVIGKITLVEQ